MARFFLPKDQIQNNRGLIAGEELRHLKRVLRLRPGDSITLFDDCGWEHEGVVRSYGANRAEIEILESYQTERESPLEVTLALGLTKGEKFDFVVEKATELGVRAVVPFVSAYTVPKLDEGKIGKRTERWKKIALSAAKQSGRTHVPEIFPLCDFREMIRRPRPDSLKLIFWERESEQGLSGIRQAHVDPRSIFIAIGPEGGFSREEIKAAVEHSFQPVGLGSRILRAETAAVTALSIVQFVWGDMG